MSESGAGPPADLVALRRALVETARAWREPEHPARAEAVEQTLAAPNRFTEEALAFALNQQMSLLAPGRVERWIAGRTTGSPCEVGVINAGNVPLAGLQDFLAVLLTGHAYLASVSSKSPALLPAFAGEVRSRYERLPARFATIDEVLSGADALLATGDDDTRAWVASRCEERGLPPERRLLRGHRYAAAVLDGRETEEEREGLAEDALLHEGLGCRNVAVIWAPARLDPDPYFEAFAAFRGVFPAHAETPGSLKMQQAFLDAVGQPHAYGENLDFLVSRGPAETQGPGHVRWAEYASLDELEAWLAAERDRLQLVVARDEVRARLSGDLPLAPLGEAQRPVLDWRPDGVDVVAFLSGLRCGGEAGP